MSLKLLNENGQSVLIDLLIGITLFLLVIATGITILDNQLNAVREQQELLQQQKAAETTLNQLVSSTGMAINGSPNWEEATSIDDVKFVGLALADRIILPEKINKFKEYSNSDYDKTKGKLLMGYDFYFRLADPETGAPIKGCPDAGSNCEAGKTETYLTQTEGKKIDTAIVSKRIAAFYNNNKWVEVIAEIIVFKTR